MAKGILIKNGYSVGQELNFKVVAYESEDSLPETAAENTIAVITNTPISGWSFSPNESDELYEGIVWFKTSVGGSSDFNALKKNSIIVSPVDAKQYINGVWVQKTAKSFNNGEWVNWVEYLYNEGNIYEDITGGWLSKGAEYNGYASPGAPAISFEANTIKIAIETEGYSGYGYIKNAINFTPYHTLKLVLRVSGTETNSGYLKALVYPELLSDWVDMVDIAYADIGYWGSNEYITYSMDVSSINEEAFICIGIFNYVNTVEIKKIWLEQ